MGWVCCRVPVSYNENVILLLFKIFPNFGVKIASKYICEYCYITRICMNLENKFACSWKRNDELCFCRLQSFWGSQKFLY